MNPLETDDEPRIVKISWYKACDCNGSSSTGQFKYESIGRDTDNVKFKMWYHPGPSCDVCGKAWEPSNIIENAL